MTLMNRVMKNTLKNFHIMVTHTQNLSSTFNPSTLTDMINVLQAVIINV